MYQDRVVLTSQDILEKDFKIDTRGYRPQEVDRFLDVIIKDYEEMTIEIIRFDENAVYTDIITDSDSETPWVSEVQDG